MTAPHPHQCLGRADPRRTSSRCRRILGLDPGPVPADHVPDRRHQAAGLVAGVEVVSKEIEVDSPALPDAGPLKLGFESSIATEPQAAEVRERSGASCVTDPGTSVECTVFHYAIRNLGNRPVRNGRFSCSDYSIIPEYRTDDGEWKQLQSQLKACTANVYVETPIEPGEAAEGNFILNALAPFFDTSPLYAAGRYEIHFSFHSSACFAFPMAASAFNRPGSRRSRCRM